MPLFTGAVPSVPIESAPVEEASRVFPPGQLLLFDALLPPFTEMFALPWVAEGGLNVIEKV